MEIYYAIDPNFDFKSFFFLMPSSRRSEMKKEKGVAYINVKGVLGNDYWAETKYNWLLDDLAEAKNDETITKVELLINSPGGQLSGLSNVLQAIRGLRETKDVVCYIQGMATSAAHAIAAQADFIYTNSKMDCVGSLGVLVTQYVDNKYVTVTSEQASKKAYDLGTDEGKSDMRMFLTKMHNLFVDEIVKGYGGKISADKINNLKGQVLTAQEAFENNFITGILDIENPENEEQNNNDLSTTKNINVNLNQNIKKESNTMDLKELKEKHPELVGEIQKDTLENHKKNTAQARTVLTSKEYPQPIKELAAKVISGETSNEALTATIATFDSFKESKEEKAAIDITEKKGETAPKVIEEGKSASYKETGEIKSSMDLKEAQDKIKQFI
jgi:ClpP class serine protease